MLASAWRSRHLATVWSTWAADVAEVPRYGTPQEQSRLDHDQVASHVIRVIPPACGQFGVLTINAPQLGMHTREHSQLRLGSRVKSSFEHSALPFSNVKVCWFSPLATTPAFLLILNVSSRHHRRMEWTTDASSMSPATCAKYPQRPVSVRSEAPARTRHLMIQQRHNLVVWM
jgi:hypothetical protein